MRAASITMCAITSTSAFRYAALSAALLLVSACNAPSTGSVSGSSAEGSIVEMAPPPIIAESRAVVQSSLVLRVQVNGEDVVMDPNSATGLWEGRISLSAGSETSIDVTWSENFRGRVLGLARASKTIDITLDATRQQEVRFVPSDFDSNIDDDEDDRSNLQERNEETDPFDAASPGTPVLQVPITVRFELPDARILDDESLLQTITPVATFNSTPLALVREGQSWIGQTTAAQNSSSFVTVNFFQTSAQSVRIATAQRSQDVGDGTEFNFATDSYETESIDRDNDDLSNIDEVLGGFNPFDSNSPRRDPCDISNFEFGCTFDTDGDGEWDSLETEIADADEDGIPDYQESSRIDADEDGRSAERDQNEDDACIPSTNNVRCQSLQQDSDSDGKSDIEEGDADRDGDGILDRNESSLIDADEDGESNETDAANNDPCIPNAAAQACLLQRADTDGDGKTDIEETTTRDSDGDGKPDFEESSSNDADNDGRVDENDRDDLDPCIPNTTNATCLDTQRDTDGDGKLDSVEGLTNDTDSDGKPDFQESATDDADSDGVVDELDSDDADACIPSTSNSVCQSMLDPDGDGFIGGADNCPAIANPDQLNTDGDSLGNACDPDDDGDGWIDSADNCSLIPNPGQEDGDEDGLGDVCDDSTIIDTDGDGFEDDDDNCPTIPNASQLDTDGDDAGNACDTDDDDDGVLDTADNCRLIVNPAQTNTDATFTVGSDLFGDACDDDDDGDGVDDDAPDNCPLIPNADQDDADGDGIGDLCDTSTIIDTDSDTVPDDDDNCPAIANLDQLDTDMDEVGDVCDVDDDNDSVLDTADNCPLIMNTAQLNTDELFTIGSDLLGDACDDDDDGDGIDDDEPDNCPLVPNTDQLDGDGDGIGDLCDATP